MDKRGCPVCSLTGAGRSQGQSLPKVRNLTAEIPLNHRLGKGDPEDCRDVLDTEGSTDQRKKKVDLKTGGRRLALARVCGSVCISDVSQGTSS